MEVIVELIPVAGTILGILIGYKLNSSWSKEENKKNITATLISSSRMEWIQDVRKHSADYISTIEDFHELRASKYLYSEVGKDIDNRFEELGALVSKNKNTLLLNFGLDENNDEIIKLINDLSTMNPLEYIINKNDSKGTVTKTFTDESEENIELFIEKMREYLNIQWRRAKSLEIGNTDYQKLEKKTLETTKSNDKNKDEFNIVFWYRSDIDVIDMKNVR